ncbi:MAG: hypothetical protein GY856_50260, partial [bacterium]|nr:hypothetical protein [bacterium]
MRRHHLIELHEQRWFPSQWRKMFQEGLGRCLPLMGGYRNLAAPLSRFLHRTGASAVLDLCSGSAEPIVHLRESLGEPLAEPENLKVFISDLYPNLREFKKAKERYPDAIEYFPQPVNALNPPAQAPRVRTILSALHHFRPDDVRAILRDA